VSEASVKHPQWITTASGRKTTYQIDEVNEKEERDEKEDE